MKRAFSRESSNLNLSDIVTMRDPNGPSMEACKERETFPRAFRCVPVVWGGDTVRL